jgi:phospholipid/cholesterol/gamma-HCH transport system permease protein
MTPPPTVPAHHSRQAPRQAIAQRLARARRIPVVDGAGEYFSFVLQAVGGLRRVGHYGGEVLRQTALLALGSVLVIVFISFMAGATCGIEGSAIARALGTGIAAPLFSVFCTTREVVPFVFGFIVAAKIGGGIVAELGAMRVSEEVDAMDVMGVPSITYLVSTRLLAAILMLPIAYAISLGAGQGAAWLASFVRAPDISQGTWEYAFYTAFHMPQDLIFTMTKGIVLSLSVVMTALYFGYRVRGGPVEVGVATARSMAVNLMLVTILNMVMTFLFWGFDPGLPVA